MNITKIFEKHKIYKIEGADFSNKEEFVRLPFANGNYNSTLAIFFKDENENLLNENLKQFLGNILKAVNIDIEEVLLVNVATFVNVSKVCHTLEIAKAILFGVSKDEVAMQVQIQNYQVLELNKIKYLFAESLEEIESNKVKKIELWNSLKLFFEIK